MSAYPPAEYIEHGYYDNDQAVPPFVAVTQSSPVLTSYASCLPNTQPAMHAYVPNSETQYPNQDAQHNVIPPGQSWARPMASYTQVKQEFSQTPEYDDRRASISSHDQSASSYDSPQYHYSGYDHSPEAYSHPPARQPMSSDYGHDQYYPDQYQQQQQHGPTYGLYDPHQHEEQQRLAQTAPYEAYDHVHTDDFLLNAPVHYTPVQPQYHPPATHEEYGQQTRHVRHRSGYEQEHVGFQPSTPIKHEFHTETCQMSPPDSLEQPKDEPENDELSEKRRAISYQHELQERFLKRARSLGQEVPAPSESFEIAPNYTYSVAQDTTPHQHHPAHHHRLSQSSTGSVGMAAPPVVPSQAHERPAPLPMSHGSPEEKKDAPPKKPALACLFCRKRKIACGPPSPDSPDKTCNQCVRRKQRCEYPTESRRGIRKTPKEPVVEEPTVHTFVHGDAGLLEGVSKGKGRRKRMLDAVE